MLRKLFRMFTSKQTEDPEAMLYSAVFNETAAQGHLLGRRATDRCTEMLGEALKSVDEPPMMRAKRAYAGYKAVEEKYSEILLEQMKPWVEANLGGKIRSLNLSANIEELLPQAAEHARGQFRENAASVFSRKTKDLLQAELTWRLANADRLEQNAFEPPPWATEDEQLNASKMMEIPSLLKG
ncbi:hypothetical protein [Rhizobium sp. ZPR3]|uniref:Uncharacterized protein n=2 Tax=unclassified Rhizobium TaxID=2613769 RepID=A0AAU7SEW7_9HYPH